MPLVILNGASGAGKTTIAEAIERAHGDEVEVFFMDREGVPPGAGEAWQRAATFEWMKRLAPLAAEGRRVLFDGQTRFSFLAEAVAHEGIEASTFILVDCDDETRTRRLTVDRNQAELANPDMMNWARFLRRQVKTYGGHVLDTSALSIDQGVAYVLEALRGV